MRKERVLSRDARPWRVLVIAHSLIYSQSININYLNKVHNLFETCVFSLLMNWNNKEAGGRRLS